jgi:hypothetical protein
MSAPAVSKLRIISQRDENVCVCVIRAAEMGDESELDRLCD